MSDRPVERGPSGDSTNARDASLRLPSLFPPGDQPVPQTSAAFSTPSTAQRYQPSARAFELPPLPGPSGTTSGRLAGVSSILNPAPEEIAQQTRRRKADELDSPSLSATSLPPLAIGVQPPHHGGRTLASPVASLSAAGEQQPRRFLPPRSPSLQRTATFHPLNPVSATISAQQAPFPPSPRSRAYAIEPGTSGIPPLPTPAAASRQTQGISGPTPPTDAARQASSTAARSARVPSASASPTTSYSSYSQGGQPSPAGQYAPISMDTLAATYYTDDQATSASAPPGSTGEDRRRPFGVPITSSGGQNVYQMMTLETTSGTVQLPVDVQAASRVADEKRRRNAGASARFRQRRKEKEKEASTTISKLEQQVKDLGEDVDFYMRERDYLAGVVLQMPNGDRHFPRPPSPRRRRPPPSPGNPGEASNPSYGFGQESASRSPREGRRVRRRTSTLSVPPPPPATLLAQGAPFQSSFGPQTLGAPLASQPHPPVPQGSGPLLSPLARTSVPQPMALPPVQPPPRPPQPFQAPPQVGPWNPYAAERRPTGSGRDPR